jgi:hypothetical protein
MAIRYVEKFTSLDGGTSYTFSLRDFEWEPVQSVRNAFSPGIGADFAHDHLGYGAASVGVSRETIRTKPVNTTTALMEAEIDSARGTCLRIGLGKLWLLNSDGTRRWAYARIADMPKFDIRWGRSSRSAPLIFTFERLSPWFAESATTGSATVSSAPYLLTLTNAGNAYVKTGLVITLTALSAAGLTNPGIQNLTTGQLVTTSRDSEVPHSSVRFDGGVGVTYSRATGLVIGSPTSWIGASGVGNRYYRDDNGLVTLGTQQGVLWLKPGANQLLVLCDGVPDFSLSYTFNGAYL